DRERSDPVEARVPDQSGLSVAPATPRDQIAVERARERGEPGISGGSSLGERPYGRDAEAERSADASPQELTPIVRGVRCVVFHRMGRLTTRVADSPSYRVGPATGPEGFERSIKLCTAFRRLRRE